jgi:phage host-nuclease inhibitor protein Gam
MIEKRMTLKVNLKKFLDEKGNELELTEQAKTIFKFLTTIVLSVSENINQPLIDVDLNCNSRADELSCDGSIKATCIAIGMIEWHCDTCEASGTVTNWQGSLWDMQERTIH